MRSAHDRPASADDPGRSYRTPLLLLGLLVLVTVAIWSLAVRERVPDWSLRLDEFRGASELRTRLKIWGSEDNGPVVRRLPGPTGVTVELPETLAIQEPAAPKR